MKKVIQTNGISAGHPRSTVEATRTTPAGPLPVLTEEQMLRQGYKLVPTDATPRFTTQPISRIVNDGTALVFSVVAVGSAPITYQWSRGGTAIFGATASSYGLTAGLSDNGAMFTCVATNRYGSQTSAAATLAVTAVAPTITVQPTNQTTADGSPVTFSIVATGTVPLAYQWKKNSVNISGATSASYTYSPSFSDNGKLLSCTVSNGVGSQTSTNATLTVTAVAPTITTQPSAQSVNAGSVAAFTIVAAGTPPLSYQWKKNGGSISGATSATLNLTTVDTDNGAAITCVVTGAGGNTTSNAASLTVSSAKPYITSSDTMRMQIGVPFSFQVTTDHPATSFSASVLPTGISINTATGLISGTPSGVIGLVSPIISATNAGGTGYQYGSLFVWSANPLTMTFDANRSGDASTANTVVIPFNGSPAFVVDWGDGTVEAYTISPAHHTYGSSGIKTVKVGEYHVGGACVRMGANGSTAKLVGVSKWGDGTWLSMVQAFKGCLNMVVTAPDTISATSGNPDCTSAFEGCAALTQTPIGSGVPSSIARMFAGCTSLTNVSQFGDYDPTAYWDLSSSTDCSYAFSGCTSLAAFSTSISMQRSITINHMFDGCTSLTAVGGLSPGNSTVDASFMFNGCVNLVNIGFSTGMSYATNFASMFAGCVKLSYLFYGGAVYTDNGTNFASMFAGCTALTAIPSSVSTANGTNFASMFAGCTALTAIPSSVSTANGTNFDHMFDGCVAITTLPTAVKMGKMTSGVGCFTGVTLTTGTYASLLNEINADSLQSNVVFSGGLSKYDSTAVSARANLISRGWTITDGGLVATGGNSGTSGSAASSSSAKKATSVDNYPWPPSVGYDDSGVLPVYSVVDVRAVGSGIDTVDYSQLAVSNTGWSMLLEAHTSPTSNTIATYSPTGVRTALPLIANNQTGYVYNVYSMSPDGQTQIATRQNAGGNSDLCKSIDGGVTWTVINPIVNPSQLYARSSSDIGCRHILAYNVNSSLGNTVFYVSNDGGSTWTVAFTAPLLVYTAYVSPNGLHMCYLTADYSVVSTSHDGGQTWADRTVNAPLYYIKFQIADDGTIWYANMELTNYTIVIGYLTPVAHSFKTMATGFTLVQANTHTISASGRIQMLNNNLTSVYVSTDWGVTWSTNASLAHLKLGKLSANGLYVFGAEGNAQSALGH